MKISSILIVFVLITILLSACAATPERAARDWFKASNELDGNKMYDLTCRKMREEVQMAGLITTAVSLLPQLIGLDIPQGKVDVSDLNFTTIRGDDSSAHVRVSGEVRMAILAFPMAYPIDETWLMVNEDGKWKWCGDAY